MGRLGSTILLAYGISATAAGLQYSVAAGGGGTARAALCVAPAAWLVIGWLVAARLPGTTPGDKPAENVLKNPQFAWVFAALAPGWAVVWFLGTRRQVDWSAAPDLVFVIVLALVLPYALGGLLAGRFLSRH